jgi:hypothetical protein
MDGKVNISGAVEKQAEFLLLLYEGEVSLEWW